MASVLTGVSPLWPQDHPEVFIRAPFISLPSRPVSKRFPCHFRPGQGESLFIGKCNSLQEAVCGTTVGERSEWSWWMGGQRDAEWAAALRYLCVLCLVASSQSWYIFPHNIYGFLAIFVIFGWGFTHLCNAKLHVDHLWDGAVRGGGVKFLIISVIFFLCVVTLNLS